jgi:dihydrodipicolinate synthase/N-acetylneuraminate lyase
MQWTGVFPAVCTQMKQDGTLDLEATRQGIERMIDGGVRGVVMMGMVGENSALRPAEKISVLHAALEATRGRVPVLSGVAEWTTAQAADYARQCAQLEIDGLMVFPAIGYKSDAIESEAHYRTVAQASALPILIYNNPIGYGVDVTPAMLQRLSDCPTLVAIKEESYDVRRVTDIYNLLGDRYAVVCGVDDLLLESAVLGVTAWVSGMANVYPRESVRLLELAAAGHWAQARALYRVLTPLFHLDTKPKLVQYIKLAAQLRGHGSEWVRAPRLPLQGAERDMVEQLVAATGKGLAALALPLQQ